MNSQDYGVASGSRPCGCDQATRSDPAGRIRERNTPGTLTAAMTWRDRLGTVFGRPMTAFGASWQHTTAWGLLLTALTSFVVMNFTGSSTFTSLSGVLREMRVAVPLQVAAVVIGISIWLASLYWSSV